MRKLLIVLAVVGLGGCTTNLQNAYNVLSGASVSPATVYIARNSFDAVEATATNYIVFCKVHPVTPGCSRTAIAKLIPAVRSGRVARSNIVAFQNTHPGQLGPVGLYEALITSTNTITAIQQQYNVAGAVK